MMKKLSKEKRNKVILVWIMTTAVISWWAFMVLRWQLDSKTAAENNLAKRKTLLDHMVSTRKLADVIERSRAESEQELVAVESSMASGDIYSWVLDTLQKFKAKYPQVEMPQYSQITPTTDCNLLPKFPYQQASLTVAGSAYYWDLGMFIADFENQFRYARIVNFELQPVAAANNLTDREKLSFKMDIIFLVKPKQS